MQENIFLPGMASPKRKITHCIFDMDGLLVDSESVYKEIYRAILRSFGHDFDDRLAFDLMGKPVSAIARIIIDHYKLPFSEEAFRMLDRQMQEELVTDFKLMPGAEQLLRHLKNNNVPIALATGSCKDSYDLKTCHFKHIFDQFDHQVLGCDPDVKQSKPKPDIFLLAASRFPDNPDPSQCLIFEDAPNGAIAGIKAGMPVVMVPDPNLPKDLVPKDIILQLDSLERFKPELFGLPPFKNDKEVVSTIDKIKSVLKA